MKTRKSKSSRSLARMVQHLRGWSVEIIRDDGTTFLACGTEGNTPPIWSHGNKIWATFYKEDLERHKFNARVVPVLYTHPVMLNDQAQRPALGGKDNREKL